MRLLKYCITLGIIGLLLGACGGDSNTDDPSNPGGGSGGSGANGGKLPFGGNGGEGSGSGPDGGPPAGGAGSNLGGGGNGGAGGDMSAGGDTNDGGTSDPDASTSACMNEDDCDDDDACTDDSCVNGSCSNDTVDIDDGNLCTTDACDSQDGVSHTAVDIDDDNGCTTDSCDPNTGVNHASCTLCDTDETCLTVSSISSFTNNTDYPINYNSVVVSTITVSGLGSKLWDINVRTFIEHTYSSDVDMTIKSPAGTIVTLTTDNGGMFDNVFNGTTWDDESNPSGTLPGQANQGLVREHTYLDNAVATPLVPEEPLASFIGEDPNGTWTLTVSDTAPGDTGTLTAWAVDIFTISKLPTETVQSVSKSTAQALTDNGVTTSTINVPNATGSSICSLTVDTNITHPYCSDIDMTLTAPDGRVITLVTDVGENHANVFSGTHWDDNADPDGQVPYGFSHGLGTDHDYANDVIATPLAPEEALNSVIFGNPNGVWTLTIADDTASNAGTLNSWSLNIGRCLIDP